MSKLVVAIYRVIYFLHRIRLPFIPHLLNIVFLRVPFAVYIGVGAKLGRGVSLGYGGLGVVIHHRAVIGSGVRIGTGVTIGGTSGLYEVPVIEDGVIISSGAKVVGPITIGKFSVIGANAVVTKNVPARSLVVGVPASVVKADIDSTKY